LDVAVLEELAGSDSTEASFSQFESGLKIAENIVSFAVEIGTIQEEYQTHIFSRLPEAFSQCLSADNIDEAHIERLN
jgi:hypothetical protein